MPKKKSSKRKKNLESDNGEVPRALQEGLPQVWLAVQAGQEIDELQAVGSQKDLIETTDNASKQKKKVIIRDNEDHLLEDTQGDVLLPQEVSDVGWNDKEELDYAKIGQDLNSGLLPILPVVRKSSIPIQVEEGQRRPSGISSEGSLFSYAQPSSHCVKYMGEVESVSKDWVSEDAPQSILKVVEMAQRHGNVPWRANDINSSTRILIISKYGIKVTDDKKQRVFGRLALHNIVNVIHYTSVHCTPILVLREHREESANGSTDLHIYECQNNDQASDICVTLGQAFDAVMNKMKMDENLHGPLVN